MGLDIAPAVKQAAGWPKFAYRNVREDGVEGARRTKEATLRRWVSLACRGYVRGVGNVGTPVWERDWDVLLILDACRVDLMEEVADEYAFVGGTENVGVHTSVGSRSLEWIRRTFAEEYADEIRRTAYVTANPYSSKAEFGAEPAELDEAWKDAWDEEMRTVLAETLTDRAVETWRRGDADRMIVHYMQPHAPFVPHPDLAPRKDIENVLGDGADLWVQVRDGELSLEEAWAGYRDNLRYVLDSVEEFLSAVDADTVAISADHGNATGELDVWGHPGDVLLPSIRNVPWVVTSATDEGEYDTDVERTDDDVADEAVQERLRSLGYAE